MSLLRSLARWAAPPIAGLSLLFLSPPPALAQEPPATVSAGAPSGPVTLASTASVPIPLARGATTPILGYSVSLTLSPGLTASADDITEGAFLTASGATTSFHVVDHGGGSFTVDAVTLGSPCGSGATGGTLFTLSIGSTLTSGSGTVSIESVLLRDCTNAEVPSAIGTTSTVTVDRSAPSVAVTSPNGGEHWAPGSLHAITWTASDAEGIAPAGITLEVSTDDGSSWQPVASGLANSGSYDWAVPATASTSARVRVTALDVDDNAASDASDAAFTIQAATTTALTTSPNPSVTGESVTLTATVTPSSASGTVEFFDGVTSLGTSPLIGGSATLGTPALAVGGHSLTAVYAGDADFTGSTSPVHTHTVDRAATTTALDGAPEPSTFGGSVTLTATLSVVAPGAGSPAGSVEFFDGATSLGSSPVASGSAVLATSALTAGTHALTAVYSGDASFAGSTSAARNHTVNAASTSVVLTTAPDPGVFLDPETLTASVTPSDVTGTVEFFDGATSLGTAPISSGTAVLVTSSLGVGVHSLSAGTSGDANHSAAVSAAVSLEIRAKIVATAGANGSVSPSGTVLVSLGATPSFTFAAAPGYHVASVTVDGGAAPLASPYTFAPVSANHTFDVQFAINPAVPPITTLSASQVRTGNDADGTTKILLQWSAAPAGSAVEVWRKGYGNYPEYDDGPTPGGVPSTPASYPPAGWTLTSVASPGDKDEPASRDFWYYVAYVSDGFGTHSPVSNMTSGTLDYHLGDVSDGTTPGTGDNQVKTSDLSVLGAHYGITGPAVAAYDYLDVGPTTNFSVTARPATDDRVDFEDLVVFALNYFPTASAPNASARPAAAARDAVVLAAPAHVHAGEDVAAPISFSGTGRILALSVRLAWDPAIVRPVSYTAGGEVVAQGGQLFSAQPGSVDGALFTGTSAGLTGEGTFATLHFVALADGDPQLRFASVAARDGENHSVDLSAALAGVTPGTFATALAPAMPNPFAHATTLHYSLARPGAVTLELFTVDGRRVRTLARGVRDAGEHRLEWNGTDDAGRPLAAGLYYARLVTPQGRWTRVITRLE